jgi:hypothetical protein
MIQAWTVQLAVDRPSDDGQANSAGRLDDEANRCDVRRLRRSQAVLVDFRSVAIDSEVKPAGGDGELRERFHPLHLTPLIFVLGVVVVVVRDRHRLFSPTLRSEDGPIFLKEARDEGLGSFVHTYMGYVHILPRIVAYAFRWFPLNWEPSLYAFAAVGIGLGVNALALSPRMSPVLPQLWQRQLVFVLLCASPARDEVSANIANLIFIGSLGLLLLSLSDDPRTRWGRWAELVAVLVLGLSGPFALFMLPTFALRAWLRRSRQSIALLVLIAVCATVQWGTLLTASRTAKSTGGLSVYAELLAHRIFAAWAIGDDRLLSAWHRAPILVGAVVVLVVVAFAASLWLAESRLRSGALLLVLLLACAAPSAAYWFIGSTPRAQRHLLLPLAIITVVFVATLTSPSKWLRCLAVAALALSLIGVVRDFQMMPLPFKPIGGVQKCLDAQQTPCLVQSNTSQWNFTLSH